MALTETDAGLYPEESINRVAYLWAYGIMPTSSKWVKDKNGEPVIRFMYEYSAKLANRLMKFKTSKEDDMLGCAFALYKLRGRYMKSTKPGAYIPLAPEVANPLEFLKTYENKYGKS